MLSGLFRDVPHGDGDVAHVDVACGPQIPLVTTVAARLATAPVLHRRARAAALLLPFTPTAGLTPQFAHLGLVQVDVDAALEATRQHDAAIADADEAADREVDAVEELAHLAVAALGNDHAVPVVDALASTVSDGLEGRALRCNNFRWDVPTYTCNDASIESTGEFSVAAIRDLLPEVVKTLTLPLYNAFEFYRPTDPFFKEELKNLTGRSF